MKAYFKSGLLIFLPYFILFLIILMSASSIRVQNILINSISCSLIISITFFYSLLATSADENLAKIPLEQLSAYAIINMIAFLVLYGGFSKILVRKKIEENSDISISLP